MTQTAKNSNGHLTSGRLLAKNTIWNLVGTCAPMAVAVFSIPILIHELGKERFGILTLAWALIGYASLFDLGLGRALTQIVARKLGAGEEHEIPGLAWTSLALMLLLGILGAVAVGAISPWLVHRTLHVPVALQREALLSFYVLAVSIPVVICTAGLRGLLEAHQRFGVTNALRVPMGVFTFLGPLLVLPFSHSLVPVVVTLAAGRVVASFAYLIVCMKVLPEFRRTIQLERSGVGPLLRFGGWMTVTNVISPLMVTLDRFVIGAIVSMAAVAYYATPYEVVTKLLVVPAALVGVMFPAFSASFERDRDLTAVLYGRCVKYVFLILFPVVLVIAGLAHRGLALWLGADFAQHSFRVLQWLAVGVLLNGLAQVPFALVQGAGRPDLTAKLHLVEFPVYLLFLVWLISAHGIGGAAIAWTARVGVDALILFGIAQRVVLRRPASLTAGKTSGSSVCVVLGGSGFLGQRLCRALVDAGFRVRSVSRSGRPKSQPEPWWSSVEWVAAGIGTKLSFRALDQADFVFHLVSTTLPSTSNSDIIYDLESNVLATVRMLEAAAAIGIRRMVFVSSGGTVYGTARQKLISEDHPTNPLCSYGIQKLAIEKYFQLFRITRNLDPIVFRVSNVYGESQDCSRPLGAIAHFTNRAVRGVPIEIWGDGAATRDYVHVDDVVGALLKSMNYRGTERLFNIGSGRGVSLNELVGMLQQRIAKPIVVNYRPGRGFDVSENVLDIKRARAELLWSPDVSLERGLEKMIGAARAAVGELEGIRVEVVRGIQAVSGGDVG